MQGTLLGSSARGTQAELFVPQICLSLRVCLEELSRSARQNGLLASGGTPLSLPMEECPEVQKLLQLLKQLNPSLRPCPGHSVLARDSLFISCLGDHQAVASDSAPPVSGGPPALWAWCAVQAALSLGPGKAGLGHGPASGTDTPCDERDPSVLEAVRGELVLGLEAGEAVAWGAS